MHRFIPALYGAPPLPDLPGGFAMGIEPWSKDLLYKSLYEVPGYPEKFAKVWDSLKVGGQPARIITPRGASNPPVFTYLDSQGKPMAKATMSEIADREIGYAEKSAGGKGPGTVAGGTLLGVTLASAAVLLYILRSK